MGLRRRLFPDDVIDVSDDVIDVNDDVIADKDDVMPEGFAAADRPSGTPGRMGDGRKLDYS